VIHMRALVVSAALALLPEVVSLGSDGLALTSGGIEVLGAAVTLYCLLRATLALVLLLSCLSAGALDRRFTFRQQVSVELSAAEVILNLGTGTALMNMRTRLFLGIPYSPLFEARNISQRLGLRWRRGEFYLLTWREDAARLSEDIQSQDFGWLYERNRSRYAASLGGQYR
jgi:hypothetical protein